jgi:hypothetical protein
MLWVCVEFQGICDQTAVVTLVSVYRDIGKLQSSL